MDYHQSCIYSAQFVKFLIFTRICHYFVVISIFQYLIIPSAVSPHSLFCPFLYLYFCLLKYLHVYLNISSLYLLSLLPVVILALAVV